MSENRFKVCIDSNNGVGLFDDSVRLVFIKFTNKEDAVSCRNALMCHCDLLNEMSDENGHLKKENKQLRKELDNFKPVMFQDMRKGTVILYSKGD